MNLIKQDGPYCLVTSAALVLDVQPSDIHDHIGHNGTEIWWPPDGKRGIHIQEIQRFAMSIGKIFAPLDVYPTIAQDQTTTPKEIYTRELASRLFEIALLGHRGILIMENHAVAFQGHTCYDPQGFIKSIEYYEIRQAWLVANLI